MPMKLLHEATWNFSLKKPALMAVINKFNINLAMLKAFHGQTQFPTWQIFPKLFIIFDKPRSHSSPKFITSNGQSLRQEYKLGSSSHTKRGDIEY